MKLIVGLGNPGKDYEMTRHNVGFMAVDTFSIKENIRLKKVKFKSVVYEGLILGEKCVLMKPTTYMNRSGESVREAVDYYNLDLKDLLVIYDDIDIDLGSIRIRKFGSGGTHNGMKDIILKLGSDKFNRLRIGIGNDPNIDLKNYVLQRFQKTELDTLKEVLIKSSDAIGSFIDKDVDYMMNNYNG